MFFAFVFRIEEFNISPCLKQVLRAMSLRYYFVSYAEVMTDCSVPCGLEGEAGRLSA